MQTIVFAGGGTAGHIMPNIALISELSPYYNCVYVGGDGMEKSIARERGIPFYTIKTVKLRRDAFFKNFTVPFKLISCVKSAKRALAEIDPQLIFSKGGYAALPVVFAAGKVPVISHESDFSPGLTTKLAAKKSLKVLCSFEECAKQIKNGVHCGTPLDRKLYSGVPSKASYGLYGSKPVLAVVGGSSGAATLNDCVTAALPELLKRFDVIHMTGKNKRGGIKQAGYCPIEFEHDMPRLYATCDIMLTRAGAGALAECVALNIPTLAVPLEKASRGDQLQNARYYSESGAVKIMREAEMTPAALTAAVSELYLKRNGYIAAMTKLSPDGTEKIISLIKSVLSDTEKTRPTMR